MSRTRLKSRFEIAVHVGLAAIICLLLGLNFASNYIIYQARLAEYRDTAGAFRQAAIATSRQVQEAYPSAVTDAERDRLKSAFALTELTVISLSPSDNDRTARRDWLRELLRRYPPSTYPGLVQRLLETPPGELSRGEGEDYYYTYVIPSGAGRSMLLLAAERPRLAYLEDARPTLMLIMVAALAVVAAAWVGLSRLIFRPFRQLRTRAEEAGRTISEDEDDSEAIVAEYEAVIAQLRDQKAELLRLNDEIQRRAESLEDFNQFLVGSSQSGVITLDTTGRITAANEAALRLLNLPPTIGAGQSCEEALAAHPQLCQVVRASLNGTLAGGYRELVDKADGVEVMLGVTLSTILNRDNREVGLLIVINDLTELHRLKSEVEEGRRLAALGEMAAGLAHQFRNSLGAISGYGVLLKKRLNKAELPSDYAEQLVDECREAEDLVSRFLSFARPLDYTPAPVDLGGLADDAAAQIRAAGLPDGITLKVELNAAAELTADALLLKQALVNLIDNAVKACGDSGGTVSLTAGLSGDVVTIAVSDTGSGISPDDLKRIFTPFYSSRPSGTGLGLPLVRKIVDLHSGHLDVRSRQGEGTIFTISLPVHSTRRKHVFTVGFS